VKTRSSALPQWLVAALWLGATAHASDAHAADIGQARLLSAAGQPLRLVVPVTALTSDEAATLTARAADPAAWQQHRLTPPVALHTLQVRIAPGLRADARDLVISADEPPQGAVVDMLLELASASGQRRVQVSVLAAPATPAPAAAITLPRTDALATVAVQRGNVLWHIARQHQYADVTLYQMLAAFYQTNQPAFIRANMNWLRAGATLIVPDAATVRAIDPLAARRLFLAHQDVFFRYRAARASTPVAAASVATATPAKPVAAAALEPATAAASDSTGDRVRLSGAAALRDQSADEEAAQQRAQRDTALRVAQLERNVSDLQQALLAAANVADRAGKNSAARPAARLDADRTNTDAARAAQAAALASAQPLVADATTERRSAATTTVVGAANATTVITDATTDTTTDAARIPGIDAAQRETQLAAPPASALDHASPPGMATRPASAQGAGAVAAPAATATATDAARIPGIDAAQRDTQLAAPPASALDHASPLGMATRPASAQGAGAVAAPAATPPADTLPTAAAPAAQAPAGAAVDAAASASTAQANQTANVQAGTAAPSSTPPPTRSPVFRPPPISQIPPHWSKPHWSNNIWVWAAVLGVVFHLVLIGLKRRNKANGLADAASSSGHEAMLREQFAQRLKTIDLNLDDAPANAASAPRDPRP